MAKALSLFYPLVLPHVVGCPNPLLDQAILYAAGEFCREGHVVQEINTQNVVAGTQDYDIDLPASSQLSSILAVFHADTELQPAGPSQVHVGTAARGAFGTYEPAEGAPTTYYQKVHSDPSFSLWPVPGVSITDGLAVRAAFEPSSTATSVADVLYDTYSNDVAFGAIAFLQRLPGQAFSNPQISNSFQRMFSEAVMKARLTSKFGRQRRSVRVQARSFV